MRAPAGWFAVTLVTAAAGTLLYLIGHQIGIRLAFDPNDMDVYFSESRWVPQGGVIYRDVPSEYPLVANLLFAAIRAVAGWFAPGKTAFYTAWGTAAWCLFLYGATLVARENKPWALMAWLAPAPIYLALYRFDIYPAVATLLALLAARRSAYFTAALWLGLSAALKGYTLFVLPAFCIFVLHRSRVRIAVLAGAIAVAPTILSLLAVFALAGLDGVVYPYRFHAVRTMNEETLYDAINYIFHTQVISPDSQIPRVAEALQIACALAAAATRPRSFDDLVNAMLLAIIGFMTFSVFYSPQYLLWSLPFISVSGARAITGVGVLFSWLSFFSYPIGSALQLRHPPVFRAAVMLNAASRLTLLLLSIWGSTRRNRTERSNSP